MGIVQSSFANAIARQEGYGPSGNLATRTNNPGDIGNTGSAQAGYPTPDAGYAALDNQVGLMFSGGSGTRYSPNMTIAQVGALYAKDPGWATGVAGILGVPASTTLAQLSAGAVTAKTIARPNGDSSSTGSTGPTGSTGELDGASVADLNAVVASPVYGAPLTGTDAQIAAIVQALEPTTLVIHSGLGETPWFENDDIVHVGGPADAVASPVTFEAFFTDSSQPLPITIELNASLTSFERSMRHISNRQQTRSGALVTLWGMEPDVISGSGSTGLFVNQFGVTDFLSLSDTSAADVQRMMGSDPVSPDAMRIGAKDAFMELLMLFRQNGMVWFQGSTGGSDTSVQQMAPDAWSSTFGASLTQMNARRNDVAARGGIMMTLRNSVYYGYFSTLSWTEDATKPFSWNFNFTFKVERTLKQMFGSSQ